MRGRVCNSASLCSRAAASGCSQPARVKKPYRCFGAHDVDIVVTDHLLGRSTAAGLAASMKRWNPYVPIVSLSGTTNVDEALKYADHFIGKGEGPEMLISTLDEIFLQKVSEREPLSVVQPSGPPDFSTSRALLAAIVEDSSDAILSKTLDGIESSVGLS